MNGETLKIPKDDSIIFYEYLDITSFGLGPGIFVDCILDAWICLTYVEKPPLDRDL